MTMLEEPEYSVWIYRLITHIENQGVRVEPFASLDGVAGRCHYPSDPNGPLIEIDEPRAKYALMTLAHEWGHYLSNQELPLTDEPVENREILAFWYGWEVLEKMRAPIARHEWFSLHFHREDHHA